MQQESNRPETENTTEYNQTMYWDRQNEHSREMHEHTTGGLAQRRQ